MDIATARKNLKKDYDLTLHSAKKDEIHVFPDPPGTGKTKTFATLIEEIPDIKVLTLSPTHQLATETKEHYDTHLRGRSHFHCLHQDRFQDSININFNRMKAICNNCKFKKSGSCGYLANIDNALESRTLISVHPYINTSIPERFLKDRNKKCLLAIDESPFQSLIKQFHITKKDLTNMHAIAPRDDFWLLLRALNEIIDSDLAYYNKEFLDNFENKKEFESIPWDWCYNKIKRWNENPGNTQYISNFIHQLKSIVELSSEYAGKNVCLPFCKPEKYIKYEHKTIPLKEITYTHINTNFPDVPIFLFDATAEKQLLEKLFPNRKIIIHPPNINNQHIPYQIVDGNYSRKTLSKESTRLRIADAITYQCNKLNPLDQIGIITHQRNEEYFKQQLIENWVTCGIKTEHYHNILGINDFTTCKMLFIIGSPEPNPIDVKLYTEALHIGEEPTMQKRRYGKYIDKRLQRIVNHIRESHLIQAYGRARTLTNTDCKVYIFNNLELPMETCEIEMKELMGKPTSPEDVALCTLYEMYGNAPGDYKKYYDKARQRSPFSDGSQSIKDTINWIESIGLLERREGLIKITSLGMRKAEVFRR